MPGSRETEADFGGGGQGVLDALDGAMVFIRAHAGEMVLRYLLVSGPLILASLFWIEAVALEDRRGVRWVSLLVMLGVVWRWGVAGWLQAWVMRSVGMRRVSRPGQRALASVIARLYAHVGTVWLGLLVLPALLCTVLLGVVSPLLMREQGAAWPIIRRGLVQIYLSLGVVSGQLSLVFLLFVLVWINALTGQSLMVETVLPSLLGLDTADLRLWMVSLPWQLGMLLMLMLVFDGYWMVVGVMVADQLQARRSGSDLDRRLDGLSQELA